MTAKKAITDAVEILKREVLKNDPKRIQAVEHYRLNYEVASLIYDLRTKSGLSQAELAKKIKTTQSVISRLEDADYEGHSLLMLAKIAGALGYRLVLGAEQLDVSPAKSGRGATRVQKLARA